MLLAEIRFAKEVKSTFDDNVMLNIYYIVVPKIINTGPNDFGKMEHT